MSPENTRKLLEAFPDLYRGRKRPLSENLMAFGFQCDDGWYDLLYALSADITRHAAEAGLDPVATQVKEKFGTLRFYLSGADNFIDDRIDQAVDESARTCEVCGRPGSLTQTSGWLHVACEAHPQGRRTPA